MPLDTPPAPPESETPRPGEGTAHSKPRERFREDTTRRGAAKARGRAPRQGIWDPAHAAAARQLLRALAIGEAGTWIAVAHFWAATLAPAERLALAAAAGIAVEAEDLPALAEAMGAAQGGAGMPIAPFLDFADEASFWVGLANGGERDAYLCALLDRLSPKQRQKLIRALRAVDR